MMLCALSRKLVFQASLFVSRGPDVNRVYGYMANHNGNPAFQAECSSGEDQDFISEEEIRQFKANEKNLTTQRAELRETLRQRFATMRQRCCVGGNDADADDASACVATK